MAGHDVLNFELAHFDRRLAVVLDYDQDGEDFVFVGVELAEGFGGLICRFEGFDADDDLIEGDLGLHVLRIGSLEGGFTNRN